ncbi:IS1 family transposase [Prodigiosinella confusarubida]
MASPFGSREPRIECHHLNLGQHLARLKRKCRSLSTSVEMHDNV